MKFVIIFGPPAAGKMTVGYELAKLTGFRLFHNQMTIDLVLNFFSFGQPPFHRLVGEFRRRIFEEVAASNLPGLIFGRFLLCRELLEGYNTNLSASEAAWKIVTAFGFSSS